MAWIVGIDEAGYGPNLGPFVMTCIACRLPDPCLDFNLWHRLRPAVRRRRDADAGEIFLDDSKLVYTARGLAGLERGVLATLGTGVRRRTVDSLAALIEWTCPDDGEELRREVWYRADRSLPIHVVADDLKSATACFEAACASADIGSWQVRAAVVCPPRFNALLDEGGTKGHILAYVLTYLLRWLWDNMPGEDAVTIFIDKHGGRNTYAAMLQHALPDGVVFTERESMACSAYRLHGLGREVRLTFQPRADGEHLCVALASMASKYLREVLMLEFNRFWREHVPELKPTAGYPGDAVRFLHAIRGAMGKLGVREESVWRKK
jgi:ribonuclease HII